MIRILDAFILYHPWILFFLMLFVLVGALVIDHFFLTTPEEREVIRRARSEERLREMRRPRNTFPRNPRHPLN